jgi:hypothetical protein
LFAEAGGFHLPKDTELAKFVSKIGQPKLLDSRHFPFRIRMLPLNVGIETPVFRHGSPKPCSLDSNAVAEFARGERGEREVKIPLDHAAVSRSS